MFMQEQKKVELIKNDGTKTLIDLISLFKIESNGGSSNYILLTANEVDQNGLIKILVAKIVSGKLEKIADQAEWSLVKNVMRSIISSSKGNFEYLNLGDVSLSYVANDNFARIIAVQESAKMQLIKDYEEKKPEPPVAKVVKEAPLKNPDAVIYPKNEESNSGAEVSPGISEAVSDNAEKNQNSATQETPNVEPSFNFEANMVNNSDVQTPNNEFVSNVEAAPLKDIVNGVKENDASQKDAAKEKLVMAIESAVDEYINSFKDEKAESLEISDLKTNIKVMQEQMDKINQALNTHE